MFKPSDFLLHYPWNSISQKSEAETVARNIMAILTRTGNEWRKLSLSEYQSEREKDGGFTSSEAGFFIQVAEYTTSPEAAAKFSSAWSKVANTKN